MLKLKQLGISSPVVGLVRKFEILDPERSSLNEDVASVEAMLARRDASEIPDGRNIFGEQRAHLKPLHNFYFNGFRRHNNLIDAANIASLEDGVSIGLHDASTIRVRGRWTVYLGAAAANDTCRVHNIPVVSVDDEPAGLQKMLEE